MDYIDPDLGSLDAEEIRQDGRDFIQAQAPAGWRISPFLDWSLGAVARMVVIVLALAQQVPKAVFKWVLIEIFGLQPNAPTWATGTVTIAASATSGGSLAAGATVIVDGVGFVTTAATGTVAAAGTVDVPIQAVEAGSAGSGLTGTVVRLSSPAVTWVETVSLTAPTSGGQDGETDDEFVDRGADLTPTLSPKPIELEDVAPVLRGDPEVYRVAVIKGLVPPTTTGVAGALTAAPMTDTGGNVSTDGKDRLSHLLGGGEDSTWIANTDPHIIDPTPNALKVSYTAVFRAGADTVAGQAAINTALKARLSPLGHGIPSNGPPTEFEVDSKIRRNDLIVLIGRVPDVEHVPDVQLALLAGSLATADVTMTGVVPVPTLADANITASVS